VASLLGRTKKKAVLEASDFINKNGEEFLILPEGNQALVSPFLLSSLNGEYCEEQVQG